VGVRGTSGGGVPVKEREQLEHEQLGKGQQQKKVTKNKQTNKSDQSVPTTTAPKHERVQATDGRTYKVAGHAHAHQLPVDHGNV
jgi:hypothetical protein